MLGQALTTDQRLSLPSTTLPAVMTDWRFLINTGPTGKIEMATPAPSSSPGGVMEWIKENQNVVFITAGALLLLAVMGKRR